MDHLDKELDRLVQVFASEMESDEQQFHSLGPQLMTTGQLISLHGKLEERLAQYTQWQAFFLKIALWSPIVLVVGGALLWLDFVKLGWLFLAAFPMALVFAAIGILHIYHSHGPLNNTDWMLEEVKAELNRRRQKRKLK